MKHLINNPKLKKTLQTLKPWAVGLLIFLVLRYSGLLSSISFVTQKAAMKTGILNIQPENNTVEEPFDYDFSLQDLGGNTIDVNAFKGKIIFLNLWATWCGPCRAEMPSIQQLYNDLDTNNTVFIMLSLDKKENHTKVVKYIQDNQFTFPVYYRGESLPEQLQVRSIPTTFIVGVDGKIKMKKAGTANYDTEKFKGFMKGLVPK
jgi:thiol-disulfide isomerase/thioredoxin